MKKKLLALILSVAVVASIAAAGTLAYLTAQTDDVVNTFTVGDIQIELKEHELKDDGTLDLNTETDENDYVRVIPGATVEKDPFIRVKANSEACYVYALVENGLNEAVADAATPVINLTWTKIAGDENGKALYRYATIVENSTDDQKFELFSNVKFATTLENSDMQALNSKTITILGYAHQADEVSPAVADAAAINFFFPTTAE